MSNPKSKNRNPKKILKPKSQIWYLLGFGISERNQKGSEKLSGIARKTDLAQSSACIHGKQCCSPGHVVVGPINAASPDVFANGLAVARQDDTGTHAACCGQNKFTITAGSKSVFVNGKSAARKDDATRHCNGPGDGGTGKITIGSPNVNVN